MTAGFASRSPMTGLKQDWYEALKARAANHDSGRLFWFAVISMTLALNIYAPASPTVTERTIASTVIVLAFGVIWYWTCRGKGQPQLGFLPTVTVVYFLEYPFTIFTQKYYQLNYSYGEYLLSEVAINKALALSLIGLPLIVAGYYWPGRNAVAKILPRFAMQWRDRRVIEFIAVCWGVFSLLAFVIFFRTKLDESVQGYLSIPSEFFFLSIIVLFMLQLEGELTFASKILLWGVLIPLRIVLGMSQGQLSLGMMVVMALAIAYTTMRRRVPWLIFAVGFGAFIVLQPVKASLRSSVFVKGMINTEETQGEKLMALTNSVELGMSVLQTFDLKDVIAVATARLDDILIFATVVERTPQDVPYWWGASYYRLLFVPIPRILYPEKPNYIEGNVLGHQYQMIADDDYVTSINLPQVTELYGNFGPIGVILGCLLFGIVYRMIHDCFVHPACGLGALVTGIYIFTHLIDIENSTASIFGGLLVESLVALGFHSSIRLAEEFSKAAFVRATGSSMVVSI